MPRANRYIVPGHIYHLTHRCHDRQFLLKLARDRHGYRRRLREAPTGAVGPDHFVAVLNRAVAVYSKSTGARVDISDTATFFSLTGNPDPEVADPRILYDWQCNRWIACIVHRTSRRIRLAISNGSNPAPLATAWQKFDLAIEDSDTERHTDYPTLGMDSNGYYIAVHLVKPLSNPTSETIKVIAIRKPADCGAITSDIVSAAVANANNLVLTPSYPRYILQPAVNYTSVGTSDYAWFLAKGDPAENGGQGKLSFARLQWTGSTSYALDTAPWGQTLQAVAGYFDADAQTTFVAPQKALGDDPYDEQIDLYTHGSRLMNVVIQGSSLYTSHHVGINHTSGTYVSSGSDLSLRSAVRWYRIGLPLTTGGTVSEYGTVFDATTGANPYWFYYPSISANSSGEIAIGFAGSQANEFIGSFFWGRNSSNQSSPRLVLVHPGNAYSHSQQWGHYTGTSTDSDGSIWTIQEYAETQATANSSNIGTRVSKMRTQQ